MKILSIQSLSKEIAIFLAVLIVCIPISYAQVLEEPKWVDVRGPETAGEWFLEGEWEDVIINVAKYEPAVLVDSVVRETNAPIYVSLYGIPTTGRGIPRIKHISIRETDTNWLVGGVRYFAPAMYSWDNLGYFETKLRRIEKIEDIPDTVDVNLIARIRYEAETTTELIGAAQVKELEEKVKISKDELLYGDYNIFDKGYIVANKVGDEKVTFSIYDSEARKIGGFTLKIDEESREYMLIRGSKRNEDIVRVRLNDIIKGSEDHVIFGIPGFRRGEFDKKAAGKGGDIGNGWKVKEMDKENNVVFIEKKIDREDVVLYLPKGSVDKAFYEQSYREYTETYTGRRRGPYAKYGVKPDLLAKGLENLIRDFGGVVIVNEIKSGKKKETLLEVGGSDIKISAGDIINDVCVLERIEADKVIIKRTDGKGTFTLIPQTPEERERKDRAYLVADKEKCGEGILLKEVHTYNVAQIKILTGRRSGEIETSFSLHIPIEKGLIGYSAEDLDKHINATEKLIEEFDKVIEDLEKAVELWGVACLYTTAFLVVGKYIFPGTGSAVRSITGLVAGEYSLLKTDAGQLYLDRVGVKDRRKAVLMKGSSILYEESHKTADQNIAYDEKEGAPYYYNTKVKGWVRYNSLNDEEFKRIWTARKEEESVIIVPILDPERTLPADAFRKVYDALKDKFALYYKGFYVVYYKNKLEIYQGIGAIDLGEDDDRRVTILSEGVPGERAALFAFEGNYIKKVNAAQRARKNKVEFDGQTFFISPREFKVPDLSCEDIFCAPGTKEAKTTCWQCRLLYNACDPVVCPKSRCDFDGRFKVRKSVQESGLVASSILCIHNIKWSKGGVAVPFCLTGILGALKGIRSKFESYKDCLLKQQKEGKTFGLCERVQSIYICELIWKEVANWLMLKGGLIGGLLTLMTGGGIEYLTDSKGIGGRVSESRKVVNFFVQSYAEDMYVAFKGKSTKEVGSEICRSFVGGKMPSLGEFIDLFATPEAHVQFTAHFEEQPYSETAKTSRYTVYYHIYAGTLKDKPKLDYYVYLKKRGERDLRIARGTLTAGEWASDTVTEVAKKGYEEICVNIDGVPNCNFGKIVSSDWAVDKLADEFVNYQIGKQILSKEGCVSESKAYLGMPVERRCEISNPGLAKGEEHKWKEVGICGFDEKGDYLGKCWMLVQSKELIERANKETCEYYVKEYCKNGKICRGEKFEYKGVTCCEKGKCFEIKEEKENGVVEVETEANKLLMSFPDENYYAKSIYKCEVPNAKYVLVHVRNLHSAPFEKFYDVKEEIELINVALDLYALLFNFADMGFKKVYLEGGTDEAQIESLIFSLGTDIVKKSEEDIYLEYGSTLKLAHEGKIEVLPAEIKEVYKIASEMERKVRIEEKNWDDPEVVRAVMDDREDIVLEKISKQDEPLAIVVHGGEHAWGGKESCADYSLSGRDSLKDNIAEWNKAHPNEKFSLIEVTPRSYPY